MAKTPKQTSSNLFEMHASMKAKFEAGVPNITQRMLDGILATATSLLDTEMTKREKDFEAKHFGSDWWELAKKQYPITQVDGQWKVTSEARDWHDDHEWFFSHRAEALEKVEQLVRWLNDNRRRGYGDREGDVERLSEKYAA